MEYGNGTKTSFDYNANTLRLNQVTALTSTMNSTGVAQTMIDKTFSYSDAGNINVINNTASNVNFTYNTLGGGYYNEYTYDGLNRLVYASGSWSGSTGNETYSVAMTYDNMGGIVQKNQTASLNYPGYPGEKYNYYYTLGNTSHPHATSKVWDRRNHKQYTYGFDNNGNPTTTHEQYAPPQQGQPNPSGPIDLIQENYWDEQNQLRGLWNLAGLHHYIYDADGQRLMKSSVPMSHGAVNAQSLQATNTIPSVEYTVYVSAGLVYESDGTSESYTKHYYAGPLRVASQIGSGNPNYETHPTSGGNLAQGGPVNAAAPTNGIAVLGDLNNMLANYGMSVSPSGMPTDTIAMQVINDPEECDQYYGNDVIEKNRCLCDNFPDVALGQGIDCSPYTPIYWYHPDYIGNVEFVTDRTGQPYQHFYYAAFGDPMVSQHVGTGSFNSAFRFNAKEYDEETGNYYYGARYYEPKSSIWMGVDALATSYPGMNPYNFTMGNPLAVIDPDGNQVDWHPEKDSEGNTVLVAEEGDDFNTLMTYLGEIGLSLSSSQISDLASQVSAGADKMNFDIKGLALKGENHLFENLVGIYLTSRFDQNKSWGNYSPNYGYNCSPTLANRSAKAVRFVYGETSPEFNKLDRNNRFEGYIGYHLFQNNYANTGRGNTNANNVKYGPDGIASYGVTKSMRGHSVAGALEYSGTGSYVPQSEVWSVLTPGAVLGLGSHTAIFVRYIRTNNIITGMVIWDDGDYYREIFKGSGNIQPRVGGNWH
jgi:RHS repeat-associated protein